MTSTSTAPAISAHAHSHAVPPARSASPAASAAATSSLDTAWTMRSSGQPSPSFAFWIPRTSTDACRAGLPPDSPPIRSFSTVGPSAASHTAASRLVDLRPATGLACSKCAAVWTSMGLSLGAPPHQGGASPSWHLKENIYADGKRDIQTGSPGLTLAGADGASATASS